MDSRETYPKNFAQYRQAFPELFEAQERAGALARASGPLDEVTSHLVQLAAAIAIRSEGAVHSHTRRALAAGASGESVCQVVNLMASTVGFPTAAAAYSWVREVLATEAG